jgi:hypothetical protein
MRGQRATYRRRDDGVLQLLTPGRRGRESLVGLEIALAVVGLALGAAAVVAGQIALAVLLVLSGAAHAGVRAIRERLTARRRRIQIRPVLPPSDDPIGLRVIRFENHASVVRVPGTAVKLPGTAASPQE